MIKDEITLLGSREISSGTKNVILQLPGGDPDNIYDPLPGV